MTRLKVVRCWTLIALTAISSTAAGESVRFDKGGVYPAPDSLNVREGTIAFDMTLLVDPAEVQAVGRYETIAAIGTTHGGLWGRYITFGCMNRKLLLEAGSADLSPHLLRCGGDWRVGQTYRMVLIYHHAMGMAVWCDGRQVASSWGDDRWLSFHACLDKLVLGSRFAHVENVEVHDRAMAREQVEALSGGDPPPASSADADRNRVIEQQRAALGLPDDALPTLAGGAALTVADVPVRDIKYIRKHAPIILDGDHNTLHPGLGLHLYHKPGPYVLTLEPGSRFNYITLCGGFKGELAARSVDGAGQTLWSPATRRFFARRIWSQPVAADEMIVTPHRWPDEIEGTNDNERDLALGLWDERSKLTEMRLQFVTEHKDGAGVTAASAEPLYPLPVEPADALVPEDLVNHIAMHHAVDERTVCLAQASPGASQTVALDTGDTLHLMVPPVSVDRFVDKVQLDLRIDADRPTALRLHIRDPEMPRITWHESDCRYVPGPRSGWQRALLTADPEDTVLPAGKVLWLSVTAGQPMSLRLGGADDTRLRVQTADRRDVLDQYRSRMGRLLRLRFSYLSEPRPWGRVKTADPESVLAGSGPYGWNLIGEFYRGLRTYRRLTPDDELFAQMDHWTHPRRSSPDVPLNLPGSPGTPRWALLQRECLRQYDRFVQWWIDNRQIDNGEFGGGPGDDTDLVNDWVSLYFMTGDEKVRASLAAVADLMWRDFMIDGLNHRYTDALHAYEDGTNANTVAALAYAGHPLWTERVLAMTRALRDDLLITTPAGHRHVINNYYGRGNLYPGEDQLVNALMFHPANYLMDYAEHPAATALCLDWFDAWYAHGDGELLTGRGARIDVKTDQSVGSDRNAQTAYGYRSFLYRLADATRDPRAIAVLDAHQLLPGRDDMHYLLIDGFDVARKLRNWSDAKGLPNAATNTSTRADFQTWVMPDRSYEWAYAGWAAHGDETVVEAALERLAKRLSGMMLMHTVAEQSADRVAISKNLLDHMMLGGAAHARNRWAMQHAVSWQGLGLDGAVWVNRSDDQALHARLYNFHTEAADVTVRLWRLLPGVYEARLGPDDDGDGAIDEVTWTTTLNVARLTPMPFVLPPNRTCLLKIDRVGPWGPPTWRRADLAVCAEDVRKVDGQWTIDVHNIGSRAAEPFEVELVDEDTVLWRGRVESLPAPLELIPSVVRLSVPKEVASRTSSWRVEVDAADHVPEVSEANNQAVWTALSSNED